MFRSILFLYEQRFAKKTASIWLRLNYFFMLPNLIFVIFPVVDYKTFINNYYSKPAYEIYRKGVMRMANGVFHLFVYRLIYYYLVPNPNDIQDVFDWLQFITSTYALIVRLAGIFHFSSGVICLFGFDLPPTFNHYFFADSFNDLWRRINMYWREFVMKVFYYPIYFKVKHIGTVKAIAVSILITFAVNWFLHAYQWFWIRGSILFTIQDISFWAVFGIAVMLNSVYLTRPRQKKQLQTGFNFKESLLLSLRVIGIFMFMSFLWSWWTTSSIDIWLGLLGLWKSVSIAEIAKLIGIFTGLLVIGIFYQYLRFNFERIKPKLITTSTLYIFSILGILLMSLIGVPALSTQIGKQLKVDMNPITHTLLNAADRENQFKGYYETMLADADLIDNPLEEIEAKKTNDWQQLHALNAMVNTKDLVNKSLKPNLDLEFKGARLQTNEFGLRDRPVQLKAPENTLRMALLGGSIEMGSGVSNEQTFENLLEDRLTKEKIFSPYEKVEIVNFAVPGTHLPQHLGRLDKIVPPFHPQVIIYSAHSHELRRLRPVFYKIYSDSLFLEYDYLKNLFRDLNLPAQTDEGTFTRAIWPKMKDILVWGLTHIKNKADSMGAIPVWMFVPTLDGDYTPEEDAQILEIAKNLGFYILNLQDFNGEFKEDDIILRRWDRHPNAQGHELLSKKMYDELIKNEVLRKRILENYNSHK